MRGSPRTALDFAVSALLFFAVLAAAAGSSVLLGVVSVGRPARWALLVALGAAALLRALAFRSEWRLRPWVAALLAAYGALALFSLGWSIHPHLSLVRAASVSLEILVAATLAGCAAVSTVTARRLLDAILAAVAAVALAGFALWLVDPSAAVQSATVEYAARFQGFEQNPNTGSMLLAVGMPLAFGRALSAGSRWSRTAFSALLLAFVAELAASGSRGALVAGFLALLAVAVLTPGPRRARAGASLAVVALLAVTAWTMTTPHALPATARPQTPPAALSPPIDAERVIPLSREIGGPWWTHSNTVAQRTLFSSSARFQAWRAAIVEGLDRPILGYGFGTGESAFVNRFFGFHSDLPENSYIGVFLQLGLVGLAVLLAALVSCLAPGVRGCIRGGSDQRERRLPATLGAAAAGLLLGVSQSYFHAAGNIAFLSFWVVLLLSSVAGMTARRSGSAAPG